MSSSRSWARSAPAALFVGSVVGPGATSSPCVLVAGAAAFAGVGAVALVAFFIPGSVCARIAVMPA